MRPVDPVEHAKRVHAQFRDDFVQFARNRRWGTCVACPKDNDGNKFPERCGFTERHDHQLDFEELVDSYRRYLRIDDGVVTT